MLRNILWIPSNRDHTQWLKVKKTSYLTYIWNQDIFYNKYHRRTDISKSVYVSTQNTLIHDNKPTLSVSLSLSIFSLSVLCFLSAPFGWNKCEIMFTTQINANFELCTCKTANQNSVSNLWCSDWIISKWEYETRPQEVFITVSPELECFSIECGLLKKKLLKVSLYNYTGH